LRKGARRRLALSMIYETPDNPVPELFYADEAEAAIYSFTAEPRKIEL